MISDKERIKLLLSKISNLELKLQYIESLLLTEELTDEDEYRPYPSFNSSNQLDILINTSALIID